MYYSMYLFLSSSGVDRSVPAIVTHHDSQYTRVQQLLDPNLVYRFEMLYEQEQL